MKSKLLRLTGAAVMSEEAPKSSVELGVGVAAFMWKVSPPPASNEAVKVFQLHPPPPSPSHLPPALSPISTFYSQILFQ